MLLQPISDRCHVCGAAPEQGLESRQLRGDQGAFEALFCIGDRECEEGLGELRFERRASGGSQLIAALGWQLHSAVLIGNPPPKVQAMYRRISQPRPGDLVMIQDIVVFWNRAPDKVAAGVGYLHWEERRPIMSQERWQERARYQDAAGQWQDEPYYNLAEEYTGDRQAPYSFCPTERKWGIAPLDPTVAFTVWSNASAIALPDNLDWDTEPSPGSVTPGSLRGMLADSGFALRQPPQSEGEL